MNQESLPRQIMAQCLKVDEYLKTLQKALVFDEQDTDSFSNTYHQMLDEMISANWKAHDCAAQISRDEFRRNLESIQGGIEND